MCNDIIERLRAGESCDQILDKFRADLAAATKQFEESNRKNKEREAGRAMIAAMLEYFKVANVPSDFGLRAALEMDNDAFDALLASMVRSLTMMKQAETAMEQLFNAKLVEAPKVIGVEKPSASDILEKWIKSL